MNENDKDTTDRKAGERIARVIARAGLASRRQAELWIAAGRVAVNGAMIRSPACNVTARDRITVDGEPLPAKQRTRLFLYHKPRGLLTTHADPRGRPTVFANLPSDLPRLISVGRLDFNTEGLLLLTNDGALARVLELPATAWLRRYRVRAHGTVTQEKLDELRAGVTISGIHYGAIEATLDRVQGSNLWLTFGIREGKNREVRQVLSHLGLEVARLIRISFGPFRLGELAEGAHEEVRTRVLRDQLGERLIDLSGADFTTPPVRSPTQRQRDDERQTAPQTAKHHAWRQPKRDDEEERPQPKQKKLRREFHGSRRDAPKPERPTSAAVRQDVVADRSGRRVQVERHGEPPQPEAPKKFTPKHQRRPRRSTDRGSGPRPKHPRSGR